VPPRGAREYAHLLVNGSSRPSPRTRSSGPSAGRGTGRSPGGDQAAGAGQGAAADHPAAATGPAAAGLSAEPNGRGDEDLARILQRALDEATRLLDATGGVVFLADEATGSLRVAAEAGPGAPSRRRSLRELVLAPGEGIVGRAAAEHQPIGTGDYAADTSFRHAPGADSVAGTLEIHSAAVAPMVVASQSIGALAVYSSRRDAFGPAAVALVRILAEHAATAVANRRLIEDLDRARKELEGRASSERTIGEMAARLSAVRDPDELLGQVVRSAGRLIGADGTILARYDPVRDMFGWDVDDGVGDLFEPAFVVGLTVDAAIGPTGQAMAERRAVIRNRDLAGAFPPNSGLDRFFAVTGFRSMIAAPIVSDRELAGALWVFSIRDDAFDQGQADLITAFAAKAAIALANARLIAELGRAREAAARRAEAERTLREIGAKLNALADPVEVLDEIVAAARRLVGADFANIDLVEPISGRLSWTAPPSALPKSAIAGLPGLHQPETLPGLWGLAVRTGRAVGTSDYVHDPAFIHEPAMDANAARLGIRAGAAVPLVFESRIIGVLQVATTLPSTFGDDVLALLDALATDAASAIATSRWIAALDESRAALARRVDIERTLREIGADISRLHDPAEVVQRAVDEAARILGADGARVDVVDPSLNLLRGMYASGGQVPEALWPETPDERLEMGISGQAVVRAEPVWTGDYLGDDRFPHASGSDAFVGNVGIRSAIAAPLPGERGPFGALTAYSSRADAFGPDEAATLSALAAQVAVSLTNARLIEDLARSHEDIARRADRERALREIAARVTAIRDPQEVLQRIVNDAVRLLEADGSRIDLYDERSRRLASGFAAGATADADRAYLSDRGLRWGEGLAGRAVSEDRTIVTGDLASDPRTARRRSAVQFVKRSGVRSLLITPLRGEDGPLGTLSVESVRENAFGPEDATLLEALATQAAVAITNSRRLAELSRSREDLGRSVATERTLRQIAARITALTDLQEVLASVVEEARRLLGSDGAHLTRMADDGSHVYPVIIAGGMDEATTAWLHTQQFPVDGGINGLAAGRNELTWTEDYLADRRIPLEADDLEVAGRMGLRAMAAAPLRAPGGGVIGTLAVSYGRPRAFEPDELERLQGMADHAAIALANSLLFERLAESEARYRQLVSTSPDVVWETDENGLFTFVSDGCLPLVGVPPEQVVGRPFTEIVGPASIIEAVEAFEELRRAPDVPRPSRLLLRHRDGTDVPVENIAIGRLDSQGRFAGGHGSARDLRPREALQRELRESEERYRYLVQASPDAIWRTDAAGRFTFFSATVEQLLGYPPGDLIGQGWSRIVDDASLADVTAAWGQLAATPGLVGRPTVLLRHADGSPVAAEISAVGIFQAGRFAGAHGAIRDVRERERLERDLRRNAADLAGSEERAHLARELHDSVTQALFSMGLVIRSIEMLLERDPAAVGPRLAALRDLQRDALAETRSLVFELRPGSLAEGGLESALRTHVAGLVGRIGLPVILDLETPGRLPLATEETLYRIAQEALHNVVKHAAAREVRLELRRAGGEVVLAVIDHGVGFEPARVGDEQLGLAGMRARAERAGGRLEIDSRPGGPTRVAVILPAEAAPS
jgi:PAS domain S-box-containing protein